MILRQDAPNVVLVRKNEEKGTHVRKRLKDAVTSALDDAVAQAEALFSLTNSPNLLFTERVLLVEGTTEQRVLPEVFRIAKGKTLGEHQIGLIPIDGSGSILKARTVLEAMDVPTVAVVDLDFAFRLAAPQFVADDCEHVAACKAILVRLQDAGEVQLDEAGLPRKSEAHGPAAAGFEKLASHPDAVEPIRAIQESLREQGFWLWHLGAVEKHFGLPGKKPAQHAVFLNDLLAIGDLQNLPDRPGVEAFCDWVCT